MKWKHHYNFGFMSKNNKSTGSKNSNCKNGSEVRLCMMKTYPIVFSYIIICGIISKSLQFELSFIRQH